MSLSRLSLAIACAIACPALAHAEAADAAAADTYDQLERIIVSATLSAQAVKDIAAETTVLLREDMDRRLNQDIRDLVRYEPGVSVTGGGRFGLSGFAIRGLDNSFVEVAATEALPRGGSKLSLQLENIKPGARKTITIRLGDRVLVQQDIDFAISPVVPETFDVGRDDGSAVVAGYPANTPMQGTVDALSFKLK